MRWIAACAAVSAGVACAVTDVAEPGQSVRRADYETAPVDERFDTEPADPSISVVDTEADRAVRRDEGVLRERPRRHACRLDEFAALIGRPAEEAAEEGLPEGYRVFQSGEEPPAGDYDPDRLNLFLNRSGKVFRMTCG
ncbi:MAG: hypothetical protein MI723_01140 [Caulobacterales bacterium]|nr:hypothetical protein [Caulobacterales bacterium]